MVNIIQNTSKELYSKYLFVSDWGPELMTWYPSHNEDHVVVQMFDVPSGQEQTFFQKLKCIDFQNPKHSKMIGLL